MEDLVRPLHLIMQIFYGKELDKNLWELADKLKEETYHKTTLLLMLKRFLDDTFLIIKGTTKQIHKLLSLYVKTFLDDIFLIYEGITKQIH